MSLHSSSSSSTGESAMRPPLADRSTAPIAAEAVAFQAAHGLPEVWDAQDFEVYLDLERAGAPQAGGGAA